MYDFLETKIIVQLSQISVTRNPEKSQKLWTSARYLAACARFTFACIAKKMNEGEESYTHSYD